MWMILVALSACAMEYQWVQADVLNLRVSPEPGSTAIARARIGTGVEVLDSSGPWRRIRLLGRPIDRPVEGWVDGAFLGGRVAADNLWAQAEEALEAETSLTLAARALALDGSDPTEWDQLADLQQQAGDLLGAAATRARASGDVSMWLGVCTGSRVELVGRVDPGGLALPIDYPKTPLDELAVASWYTDGRPVVGTPFATPFLTNSWNEVDPNPWSRSSESLDGDLTAVLGPCTAAGVVYSTLPLSPRHERGASVRDAASFLDNLPQASMLYGLRVRRPMDDEPDVEVQLIAPVEWYTCGGLDETRHQATGIALLDEAGESQLQFGGPWFNTLRGNTPVSVSSPRWFTTLAGQRLLISDAEWFLSAGLSVAVEGAETWSIHHQVLRTWGC